MEENLRPELPDMSEADFPRQMDIFKAKTYIYTIQESALQVISKWIVETVNPTWISLSDPTLSHRGRFAELKRIANRTEDSDKEDTQEEYHIALRSDRSTNGAEWYIHWERVHQMAEKKKITDLEGYLPKKDFLDTAEKILPDFPDYYRHELKVYNQLMDKARRRLHLARVGKPLLRRLEPQSRFMSRAWCCSPLTGYFTATSARE